MLIRLVIENIYSFGEKREFNMLPQPRLRTLDHHKHKIGKLELLKIGAIYGANGAGKSNLLKALELLKTIALGASVHRLEKAQFKFGVAGDEPRQLLAIQFLQDNIPFYYGLQVADGVITCEELYRLEMGKKDDALIFERTLDESGKLKLRFPPDPAKEAKNRVFIEVLTESYIRPDQAVLKLLSEHEKGTVGTMAGIATNWFAHTLTLVTPETRAMGLPQFLDIDAEYKQYADHLVRSLDLGISKLEIKKQSLLEFLGDSKAHQYDGIVERLENTPGKRIQRNIEGGGAVVLIKEGNEVLAKTLQLTHQGVAGQERIFDISEESDGTARLLDFIPILKGLADQAKVYVIDEIERSVHAILIKEIVRKFSLDTASKGQLIFTTHESNLLDQEILRQDEIWFAEKDRSGNTDLYSLSDFKEHNTLDIRKGYLQGRYGAVPFMGNFQNLNWHADAAEH